MKSNHDYTKFLTINNSTIKPPKNSHIIQNHPPHQKPISHALSNISSPYYNFNPKVINRYSSANKIHSTNSPTNNPSYQSHLSSISIDHDNSLNVNSISKPSNTNTNISLHKKSGVSNYLNRRHVQELERLKRYKNERDKKEKEEFSFKPKISNKSKAIVKNFSSAEHLMLPTNTNTTMSNTNCKRNQSKSFFEGNNNNSVGSMNKDKNMNDYVNKINPNTCYDKENVVKYKLDVEAKEYVLERMKVIRNQYYNSKWS